MTPDAARAARAESLFRSVNERIAETAQDAPVDDTLFICECRDPAVERVVERERSHDVVEKDAPGAAETAADLDPRS